MTMPLFPLRSKIKALCRKIAGQAPATCAFGELDSASFYGDGLITFGKNLDWLNDRKFQKAYALGINSGHGFQSEGRHFLEFRVHTCLWAAQHALSLGRGDFVECGVNTGILSLAICDYLDFGELREKKFYLFDTFEGIPAQLLTKGEEHLKDYNSVYKDVFDLVQHHFAPFPNAVLVRGVVPDSLRQVDVDQVSYLSIDMNSLVPEKAALEHFWPKIITGGVVVFDDYGWRGHEAQRQSHDEFAAGRGLRILTLPTGQGVLIKSH